MESNKRICKECKQEKDRILVGRFNDKDKKYHDGDGLTWNGNSCGLCHKEIIRRRMQAMRILRKALKKRKRK